MNQPNRRKTDGYSADEQAAVHSAHAAADEAMVKDAPGPLVRDPDFVYAWWMDQAQMDAQSVVSKLADYGSLDFHARAMLELIGRPSDSLRNGTEAAIASYLAGKLNRVLSSLSRGLLPAEDSWDDFCRYAMMARYVRKYGRWP